jgi:hypothetical protein
MKGRDQMMRQRREGRLERKKETDSKLKKTRMGILVILD